MGGRRLAGLAALLACTCFAPPASAAPPKAQLAYAHGKSIYALNADGSGRRALVGSGRRRGVSYGEPAWAPNGRALAFTRTVDQGGDDEQTQIMLLQGGRVRAYTRLRKDVSDGAPAWSPDGSRIAFGRFAARSERVLVTSIRTARVDGEGARTVVSRRLDRHLQSVGAPNWLPDGRRLAFTRSAVDRRGYMDDSVYQVGEGGGRPRRMLRHAYSAAWSRDGSTMAYVSIADRNGSSCGSDECTYNGEIYVARGNGDHPRRLTRNTGDDGTPAPSPDGRRILFTSDRNDPEAQSPEVYSVGSDGSCLTWLTNGAPDSGTPVWRASAGGRIDPGACGAAGRPALVETRVPKRPPAAFWLGLRYRSLLLSEVSREGGARSLDYGDCARFNPGDCAPSINVSTASSCVAHPFIPALMRSRTTLTRARGHALLAYPGLEGGFALFTGRSDVEISVTGAASRRRTRSELAAALRRVRRMPRGRAQHLGPPRVPSALAQRLRTTVRTHRRVGGLRATARALHTRPGEVRRRLRFARALHRVGGIRTTRCR